MNTETVNWIATKERGAIWCFATTEAAAHVAVAALLRELAAQIASKPGRMLYGLTMSYTGDEIEMDVLVSDDPEEGS